MTERRITYLDDDHNVVPPDAATWVVTAEVDASDETVSEVWRRVGPAAPESSP